MMIPDFYRLNENQRRALRSLGEWEFLNHGLAGESPYKRIHGNTLKALVRMGIVRTDCDSLTNAGLAAAALLEEIDQQQSSRKES